MEMVNVFGEKELWLQGTQFLTYEEAKDTGNALLQFAKYHSFRIIEVYVQEDE